MYFPVFFADIYDTTVRFSEGENGCRLEWSYFSSSREEHNTLFHRFENRVAELLKPSEGAKSRIMQAVAVYQKLTTETEYDFNEETGIATMPSRKASAFAGVSDAHTVSCFVSLGLRH